MSQSRRKWSTWRMPNFETSKTVKDNIGALYAYLKRRSDGAIQPGRLEQLK